MAYVNHRSAEANLGSDAVSARAPFAATGGRYTPCWSQTNDAMLDVHLFVAQGISAVVHTIRPPNGLVIHAPAFREFSGHALVHLTGSIVRIQVVGKAYAGTRVLRALVVEHPRSSREETHQPEGSLGNVYIWPDEQATNEETSWQRSFETGSIDAAGDTGGVSLSYCRNGFGSHTSKMIR